MPSGWRSMSLGEIAQWGSGGTPKRTNPSYFGGSIPWVVIGDLTDGVVTDSSTYITEDGLRASTARWIPPGAVLLAMYGSIGKLGIAGIPLTTNQAIAHAVVRDGLVDAKYLFWYLRSIRDKLRRAGKGGTQQNISQSVIRGLPIPVPPLDEQRRIVLAVEEQLTRISSGQGSLDHAHRRLRVYWRSLLTALTTPTPSWHTVPLTALASGGKHSLAIGPFGSNLKVSDYRESGVPLIFVRNVRTGQFLNGETRFVSATKASELAPHQVVSGDVLVTKMGDPPGDAALYPAGCPPAIITADVIKITVDRTICQPEFLVAALGSAPFRAAMLSITQGVAQKKVSLERFKKISVPLPPLYDQRAIVDEASRQRSSVEILDSELRASHVRADALRMMVLRRAFTGQFVP